jgi:serine/threonine-protein kinase
MDMDRNLLFGVLALQADLLDNNRFAEACSAWAARKDTPLADLLVERGWLNAEERGHVEFLLDRKLKKHEGDARAVLAEVTTDHVRQFLAGAANPDIRHSLDGLNTPPPQGHVLLSTTFHATESRERYTLTRLHATGGIGRVWLAHDPNLGRDVALKELLPERADHPETWARFLKEAQVTGQLEHPGIVPIYEVGKRPDDQTPFYTMRFVRGRTLAEAAATYHSRLGRNEARPAELRELVGAFVGVCNAVAYAHSRGVLHRDLKPQNVVLGDFGEVIVLDWGLARLIDEKGPDDDAAGPRVASASKVEATSQGQVLGTPAYMAPEQAEGRLDLLGPATDVYGLGAVLYEILAGKSPFTGSQTLEVLRRVAHEPPTPPRSVSAGVPAPLEAICLKALAKKPRQRYATAKELAADVQRWLADEPVTAYREPMSIRAGRWVKRHRPLVAGAAAACLVALVGLGVVLAVQARSNRELAAANQRLEEANERERERFDLAVEAIRAFHTGVSHDVLVEQEQFKDLRNRLLSVPVGFYRKLEKLMEGQEDARSRRALGQAYFELGRLTDRIGSKAEALAEHERARAIRQQLTDREPANTEFQRDLASSDNAIGKLLVQMGKPAEALAAYERARAVRQRLVDADPSATPYQSDLAWTHNDMGGLFAQSGKREEALAAFERARAIYEKLADANPAVAEYRSDVAGCHNNIGILLRAKGQLAEALAAFEQARVMQEKLVEANPAIVTQYQKYLANHHANIGMVLVQMGKPGEALAAFEKARAIYEQLTGANAAVTEFQSLLAGIHTTLGYQLVQMGKPAEALPELEKALAIRQKLADANPAVPEFLRGLAGSHGTLGGLLLQMGKPQEALGELEKARALYEKLAGANPAVADFQNDLASGYTNAADALRELRRVEEARAGYERAVAIRESLVKAHPTVILYSNNLAYGLKRLALIQQAAAAAAAARRACALYRGLPMRSPGDLVELAGCEALLAGLAGREGSGVTVVDGRAAAAAAMEALRKAIAGGYRNRDALVHDPSFDALRPRDDFQKLMKDTEPKPQAKGP